MRNCRTKLLAEQRRCGDILMRAQFGGDQRVEMRAALKASLARAEKAAVQGDVVAMIQSLEDLNSYSE